MERNLFPSACQSLSDDILLNGENIGHHWSVKIILGKRERKINNNSWRKTRMKWRNGEGRKRKYAVLANENCQCVTLPLQEKKNVERVNCRTRRTNQWMNERMNEWIGFLISWEWTRKDTADQVPVEQLPIAVPMPMRTARTTRTPTHNTQIKHVDMFEHRNGKWRRQTVTTRRRRRRWQNLCPIERSNSLSSLPVSFMIVILTAKFLLQLTASPILKLESSIPLSVFSPLARRKISFCSSQTCSLCSRADEDERCKASVHVSSQRI